jgi:hypothetical protein
MNLDYTYISLFGFLFFEPMVVLTNVAFFLFSVFFYRDLVKFKNSYAKQMACFILFLGTSSLFGAIGHTVHYQLGDLFFEFILLLMNAFSLLAVYFLFRATYAYSHPEKELSKLFITGIFIWIAAMLFISRMQADFTLIKIHAGVILLYTLFVHYRKYLRSKERGNELLILGVLISFLPILIHSMRLSINEWFNYKDLAHLFMIFSLIIIYKGLRLTVLKIETLKVN